MNYGAITIGPIIDTLSIAASPGTLWCASTMFSRLAGDLCESICHEIPDAEIVAPAYEAGFASMTASFFPAVWTAKRWPAVCRRSAKMQRRSLPEKSPMRLANRILPAEKKSNVTWNDTYSSAGWLPGKRRQKLTEKTAF